jgi:hypothetical protein
VGRVSALAFSQILPLSGLIYAREVDPTTSLLVGALLVPFPMGIKVDPRANHRTFPTQGTYR